MSSKNLIAFLGDVYVAQADVCPHVDSKLTELLADCDYVVANLEGPITAVTKPIPKTGPVMSQSVKVVDLLRRLSVNAVGLANNHVCDHGQMGLSETLQRLSEQGFAFGGAGLSIGQAYSPIRLWSKSERLSILCAGENGFGCFASPNSHHGYAWLFAPEFESLLVEEAKEADHIIVFAHGGVEHIDRPLPEFRWAYQRLVDLGASAIIAHHPHIVQGIEMYEGAPIFYSLGNFYFAKDRPREHWYRSLIPILSLEPDAPILYDIHHAQFDLESGIHYDASEDMRDRMCRLSNELHSETYNKNLEQDLLNLWRGRYRGQYEDVANGCTTSLSSLKRTAKRLVRLLLGQTSIPDAIKLIGLLEIESHRWAVAGAMRVLMEERSRMRDA